MADTNRRKFLGGLAFSASGLATTGSLALENDGHAAGYEVARASDYTSLIPRRAGDPVKFTTSLDKSAIKATSGDRARQPASQCHPCAEANADASLPPHGPDTSG
jgi:oxalate decarboxylase